MTPRGDPTMDLPGTLGASRIFWKSRGAVLESGRKGSRTTAATASGPQPPDRRRVDAGAAIGVKIALQSSIKEIPV